jgi:putative aldouronate transport system substrate-binding protein
MEGTGNTGCVAGLRGISMKKKAVRIAAILIILPILFMVVAACGIKPVDDAALQLEERLRSLDLKEADITFSFPGEAKPDAQKVLDEIQNRTGETLRTRVHFNWIPWEVYIMELAKLEASGDDSEVFGYSEHLVQKQDGVGFYRLAERGSLLDLSSIFIENAPGLYSRFSHEELVSGQYKGRQMAIPALRRSSKRLYAVVREDFMEKYIIPPIETYEDYEYYLKTIREREKKIVPGLVYNSSLFLFAMTKGYEILDFNHGLVYKRDGTSIRIEGWEQTQEYRNAIATMRKWYDNSYVLKNMALYMSNVPYSGLMNSGKYASCIEGFDGAYSILKAFNSEHPGTPYTMYPLYPEQDSSLESPMTAALVFNARGRNPERAMLFLEWVYGSQKNYDLLLYGMEDHHYLLQGQQYKLPYGVTVENHPYMGWSGSQFFKCMEYERTNADEGDQYRKRYRESMSLKAAFPAHAGFTPDFEPVSEESFVRMHGFFAGVDNPFSFDGLFLINRNVDQVTREQNTLYLQRVISEMQKQLELWEQGKNP